MEAILIHVEWYHSGTQRQVRPGPSTTPSLGYDVFTELDPLGTGPSKPYVDKKLFFQELKNPPKKVLKDLVPNQTLLSEISVTTEPKPDYGSATTMTSLTRQSGGSVTIAKPHTAFTGTFFTSDPFAETDPFDNTDPFSDSFKDDPFTNMQEFPKSSIVRVDELKSKLSRESATLDKTESIDSAKNVFNGPLQVTLPPEPAPKSPRLQRQIMSSQDFSTLTHSSPVLTNEKLSEALTEWFQEEVKFTHWEYIDGAGKGDAYLSDLIRIRIHGTSQNGNKEVRVVLKMVPKSISRQLTFRNFDFFRNEINFYEKVLPVLLKFQSTKTMTDPFDKYAKVFLCHTDGMNDVLCLEDVSIYNFGSAVRQEGIDFEHCKLTMKALAQFHALSFTLKDQEPELFEVIRHYVFEVYYAENLRDWYQRFWNRISGIAIDAVEKEYPNSIYEKKIKAFAVPERYSNMIEAATKTVETGVISHGDSWTNNFLFQYENNVPVDAKIIDFQLSRCATPVLDISFLFCACTTQDLRLKHYDELIEYYYEVLSKQIREMGSDPDKVYSRTLFLDELKKYSYFGLAFSFESTPMIVLAPEDAVDMEMKGDQKLNIDDVWQIQPFKTKEGRLREAGNVVFAVDRGYI